MHYIKVIVLGIVQGLSEFLPISSSGHLVILQHFFGMENADVSFEVVLHLGSLLAVLLYFRQDLFSLCRDFFRIKDKSSRAVLARKEVAFLLVATAVTGFLGLMFQDTLEALFSQPLVVCGMLLLTGVVLIISDMVKDVRLDAGQMGFVRAMIIGVVQALAIVPGISRSGSTVCASLFLRVKRGEAARFSFLLSIPAITGAFVLKLDEISASVELLDCVLGAFFAFVSGYLVIAVLLRMISAGRLKVFGFYCFFVSSVCGTLILAGF